MIQLISGYKAFYSAISKKKFNIPLDSLNQILILNTPQMQKWV